MNLTAADLTLHERLGIPADLLAAAGAERVTDREARELLTSKHTGDLAGVVYPYRNPTTSDVWTHRLRRDHPEMEDGEPRDKYLAAFGDAKHLYFPPRAADYLADSNVSVVFVEAEKSVLAITAASDRAGRCVLAVGTGGCWGWRGRIGKTTDASGARVDEKGPLSDLDRIEWGTRDVVLLFDGNAATNANVRAARRSLAKELAGRGARVRVAELPVEDGINGPDDYLAKHGDTALFRLIDDATVDGNQPRRLRLTPASNIAVRLVRWLWRQRLPGGALSLVAGREGVGKSLVTIALVADVTRGQLDGIHRGNPRNVIIVATEDSWEHTIVPRLIAANADLERVFRLEATTEYAETAISLPTDLAAFEEVIGKQSAALVVLDPLMSRLDAALDSHKDAEVRRALEPLVAVANRTGCAMLGLIHVNKTTSADPLTTVMGSRAFAAVARAVLFVMSDPDDEQKRLVGQIKNNLGRTDLPTLGFRVVEVVVARTDEGTVVTGKLEWTGEEARPIRDVFDLATASVKDRTAGDEAGNWLFDFLTEQGGAALSSLVKQKGREAGHSKDALKRGRHKHGIRTDSRGYPRCTYWLLPTVGGPAGSGRPTAPTAPTAPTEETSQVKILTTSPVGAVSAVGAVAEELSGVATQRSEAMSTSEEEADAVRF